MDLAVPIDIRQSCLLHLRRLVPKYWSIAFESFSGTPISQDLKPVIRDNLIKLVVTSGDSKIRNSASYVIVQIAVADYPDEWPDLLLVLYNYSRDFSNPLAVEGSLKVLNDLFDDLVSEEQFWNDNIGSQLIHHISVILLEDSLNAGIKTNAIDLYKNVLTYLTSPEAFSDDVRKKIVYDHLSYICELFYRLIKGSSKLTSDQLNGNFLDLNECRFRGSVYQVLSSLIGSFNKKISLDLKSYFLADLLNDFLRLSDPYLCVLNLNDKYDIKHWSGDALKDLTNFINDAINLILLLQHSVELKSVVDENTYYLVINNLISVSTLPLEDSYDNDFNTFITENTGLSGFVTVRDSVNELFSELNNNDSNQIFKMLVSKMNEKFSWEIFEAKLYVVESMFQNEDTELEVDVEVSDIFSHIMSLLAIDPQTTKLSNLSNPLVVSRVLLVLPKFFEKFEGKLDVDKIVNYKQDIQAYNNNVAAFVFSYTIFICCNIEFADPSYDFVKASCLISCTNYRELIDFKSDFNESNSISTQQNFFKLVSSLVEESEEDALPVLLEALAVGIDISPIFASKFEIGESSVIDLILSISFKDPSNVQSIIESSDCLKTLLENIDISVFARLCQKSLPFLLEIVNSSVNADKSIEYSPRLNLSLDLLGIVIDSIPPTDANGKVFLDQFFEFIYPPIRNLLLYATDDQLLQSGGSVFNGLIQNASSSFTNYKDPETGQTGFESMLSIVSKFLSTELSDSAALNCGTIVTSLINKFQQQLGDQYLSQILSATAQRLLIAKEVITVENLIMLFCNLVLVSPESMVNYLGNELILRDPVTGEEKPSLALILPIWFQSFEVTRGYEKIKQNALALGKIFSLADNRIENLVVNGDIIPYEGDKILTRSMTKLMPERYTQISASLKILKLLVSELDFQCQQPNAEDFLPDKMGEEQVEEDDDGWEDLEDIGVPNYDKLKSYIESDDEEEEDPKDDDLKNLLVHFFKECASRNLGNFSKYYDQLLEDDKKIITENVLF